MSLDIMSCSELRTSGNFIPPWRQIHRRLRTATVPSDHRTLQGLAVPLQSRLEVAGRRCESSRPASQIAVMGSEGGGNVFRQPLRPEGRALIPEQRALPGNVLRQAMNPNLSPKNESLMPDRAFNNLNICEPYRSFTQRDHRNAPRVQ